MTSMPTKRIQVNTTPYDIFKFSGLEKAHGCIHLMKLKGLSSNTLSTNTSVSKIALELMDSYRVCVRYSILFSRKHQIPIANRNHFTQMPMPKCTSCTSCLGNLHMCLHCVFIGCWKDGHIQGHLKDKKHTLAMNYANHTVYCRECRDYVYDVDLENVYQQEKNRIDCLISKLKGQIHEPVGIWNPSSSVLGLIRNQSTLLKCPTPKGLWNMGSTCFMNVILQCCLYNPMLRAHFLGDKHNHRLCSRPICLACETDKLFISMYDYGNQPVGPASFLYCMWISESNLAGYSQQDAHEFFIAYVNGIHESEKENGPNGACHCIVHRVFSGLLQSKVTCSSCNNSTVTFDPILDISLDVQGGAEVHRLHDKKSGDEKGVATCTIYECFDKFTTVEKLDKGYNCSSCGSNQNVPTHAIKTNQRVQLSKCPLKRCQAFWPFNSRFEHSQTSSSKVNTHVDIFEEIDLTRYSSNSIAEKEKGTFDQYTDSLPCNQYQLFGVVSHTGSLETGHYIAHTKSRDQWFTFDDHKVTLANPKDILNGDEAYMLFYMLKTPL